MSTALDVNRLPVGVESNVPASPAVRLGAQHATVDPSLFESLVSDLHWSLFHVGTLGQLAGACARAHRAWTLRPWRHLMHDNSAPALLTLRYAPEMGLSANVAAALAQFEKMLAVLQTKTLPFAQQGGGVRWQDLPDVAGQWRRLAKQGIDLLDALEPYRSRLLPKMFAVDAQLLANFLHETAKGDTHRVSEFGEITLPALNQRRRKMRKPVEHACQVWVDGQAHDAQMSNMSVDGLGLLCEFGLHAGQGVEIVIGDRRLRASIVWSESPRYGLRLDRRLSADDPLIARNSALTH